MERFVTIFVVVIFSMVVTWFVFVGFVAYKAIHIANTADMSGGIKPQLEKLWCGKPDCTK
jgi:regulatory protein YycH of two-component signal transduction system YycFG